MCIIQTLYPVKQHPIATYTNVVSVALDCASALVQTINPTPADCELYLQFAQTAVDCRVTLGWAVASRSITHQITLLLVHVYLQTKTDLRGL